MKYIEQSLLQFIKMIQNNLNRPKSWKNGNATEFTLRSKSYHQYII